MAGDYAVLTGDLVRSTRATADAADATFSLLSDAAGELARWHGASLRLTRFRGDGWQALLKRPGLTLRSALFLHAALKAAGAPLETRIAGGIGPIERPGTSDLSDASGEAFRRAGKVLDAMRRGRRLALAREGGLAPASVIFTMADALAQRWTRVQCEVLVHALPPDAPIQSVIADLLGTRQQNIAARLDAAGYWALDEAMAAVEVVLEKGARAAAEPV